MSLLRRSQTHLPLNNSTSCVVFTTRNVSSRVLRQVIVYFRLSVVDDQSGNVTSFEAGSAPDTFEPDLWIWAASKGNNLVRVPLDFGILSFGLLTIKSAQMTINVERKSADCLAAMHYNKTINILATFLANNVTVNGSASTADGPIVCRSAYAFNHSIYGQRGIGTRSDPSISNLTHYCMFLLA
jgi:hypothetical protein